MVNPQCKVKNMPIFTLPPTLTVDGIRREVTEGSISGTSLTAEFSRDCDAGFELLKIAFVNTGNVPLQLGSCRLAETRFLPGGSPDDRVFLDSGGGWPAGVFPVTGGESSPTYSEYWNPVYVPPEDLAWARELMHGDLSHGAHYSFGSVAALQRDGVATVFGFVVPVRRCNTFSFLLNDPDTGVVRALALVSDFAGYELRPGERIETEEAVWGGFPAAQDALEAWSSMCAVRRNVRLRHTVPPVGWLSWYGYRLTIDAEEINRVADFINAEYPGFGFKYMQIDLGYNEDNVPGKWFKPNDRFPGGLAKYADGLRRRGFTPGIWCGLFTAAEGSGPVHGRQTETSQWPWEPHSPCQVLDPTHPEVVAFVRRVMRFYKYLGIKYFKIDFMCRIARVDEHYHPIDPAVVRGAEAYRDALKLVLDALDSDDYFYSCSNLPLHSVGLCSTTMTACDIGNPPFRGNPAKRDFFKEQFKTTMSRYFLHGKLLLLNADAINIAPPCDLEEARMRTLFVALSGGQVFLGDKFQLATPEIRALVKQVLPPTGRIAEPLGLFDTPTPEILRLDHPGRSSYACFNFDATRQMTLSFPDGGDYEVWNFYEQCYEGCFSGSFTATVPGETARLFIVTPARPEPQVVGTTFHISGGAVELTDVIYRGGKLRGVLTRPAGDAGAIFALDSRKKVHRFDLTGAGTPVAWEMAAQ